MQDNGHVMYFTVNLNNSKCTKKVAIKIGTIKENKAFV